MDCGLFYDKVGVVGFKPWDLIRFQHTFLHILKEGSLLDVGCGEGFWLNFLSRETDLRLFGSDISTVRLDAAKRNLNNSNIALSVDDIRNLHYKGGEFDQVTALEVLEHVPCWKEGLDELIKVASKRIVITVPYNERLKYELCPECGSKASLDGHLYSFTEENFRNIGIEGYVSFHKLPQVYGLDHYIKRAIKGVARKAKSSVITDTKDNNVRNVICPDCYKEIPYTKYMERAIQRLLKLITRAPEYLLVKIDK